MVNGYPLFTARIPSYLHPDGRTVGATEILIFGALLSENSVDAVATRTLTLGEVRSALIARWPHLASVEGIEIARSKYDGHTWECEIVPAYAIGCA